MAAMPPAVRPLLLAAVALALPGCVARAAWNVVTLPVEVAAETVDVLTTSQSEADEKRGRALREAEERRAREERAQARAEAEQARRNAEQAQRDAEQAARERRRAEREARRARDRDD
jgi:hypothetical protein